MQLYVVYSFRVGLTNSLLSATFKHSTDCSSSSDCSDFGYLRLENFIMNLHNWKSKIISYALHHFWQFSHIYCFPKGYVFVGGDHFDRQSS
jgi:hypothetical protein